MTATDDAYASDPTSPQSEAVWGDPWQMDPERHHCDWCRKGYGWAPPFDDDYDWGDD